MTWQNRPPSFPLSITAYLVIVLAVQRTGGTVSRGDLLRDLAFSCLAALVVAALGWALASLVTADRTRRGLVALIAALWSLLYGSYAVFARSSFGTGALALAIWSTLAVLVATVVLLSTRPLEGVRRALSIAGAVLVLVQLPGLARLAFPADPNTPDWSGTRDATRPDIYVVVLDKYSRGDHLAAHYGLDHTPFEDSLRALGFAVPRAARANYAHTKLALTAFLESGYPAVPGVQGTRAEFEGLSSRIQAAPLWVELQRRGYRVAFYPSTYNATATAAPIDLLLRAPRSPAGGLAETWIVNSPFAGVSWLRCGLVPCEDEPSATPYPVEDLASVDWKLRVLETLPDSAGPIAAFLHLLVPHEPYLFNEDCSARDPWWPLDDLDSANVAASRLAYAAQVRCLDQRLLGSIRALLARSRTPPVILLQGDHGQGLISVDVLRGVTLERDSMTVAQLEERMSVFAAYLMPRATELVWDSISPVNVLPLMRHAVFGDSLVRLPDRSYWSPYQRALDLVDVTPSSPAARPTRRP